MTSPRVGDYVLAELVGFGPGPTRCRVYRVEAHVVFVRTADLRDAGTPLALDPDKVRPFDEAPSGVRHRLGLVVLDG